MQLFIANSVLFSKENLKNFDRKNPAAHMAQKQKSRTTKSPLTQDWVFRPGL